MLTFKKLSDIDQLPTHHPSWFIASTCLLNLSLAYEPYDAELDGYVVLIEEGDVDVPLALPELPRLLVDVPWEGATKIRDHFHAVYIANNDYGLSFLIPDAPWLRGRLRELLEEMASS